MPPEPDSRLIACCRAGDQDAFRELVEQHHERVYRTAFAVTADPVDASDIEQETFVRAWQGLRQFRGEASLATWLTRLALNAARDHLRRRRTRALLGAVFARPGRESEAALRRVEDRDELQRALRRLPDHLRRVVALRYGGDLSTREMAEVLGCPEGTVKSRLNAAVARLREVMQAERPFCAAAPWQRGVMDT